jgi:hypothetical protein
MRLRERLATRSRHVWVWLNQKQRAIIWAGCILMLVLPIHGVSASGGGEPPNGKLGFGFFVLAGDDTNADGLEKNNRMWFAIEPGSTGYREFRVSSTSQVTQKMSMGLIPAVRENGGNLVAAPELQSDASKWVTFEPSIFDLAPGDSKTVRITFSPPAGTDPVFVESFIEVLANKKALQTAKYAIPTALATNFPVTLTIGNADQLAINFDILDVEGFLDDEGTKLRVYVKNTGRTPISPSGFVQFSSLDFDSVRSDELNFAGASIFPNSVGSIDVPVSDPVVAGKWRVLVSASQGSTRVTEIFEKDLTFDGPPKGVNIPFSINWDRILLAIFAVMLLVFAKRSGAKPSNGSLEKSSPLETAKSGALSALIDWWKKASAEAETQNTKQIHADSDALVATDDVGDVSAVQMDENIKFKSMLGVVSKWVKNAQTDNAVVVEKDVEPEAAGATFDVVQDHDRGHVEFQEIKLHSEKLRELQKLFADGVISKTQFDKKRKEILDRL